MCLAYISKYFLNVCLMQSLVHCKAPSCGTAGPLVTGANPIPDSYMTASSSGAGYPASSARLHGTSVWRAESTVYNSQNPVFYIQVSFGIFGLGWRALWSKHCFKHRGFIQLQPLLISSVAWPAVHPFCTLLKVKTIKVKAEDFINSLSSSYDAILS